MNERTAFVRVTSEQLLDPNFPPVCVMTGESAQTVRYVGPTGAPLPLSQTSARRMKILPRIGYWLIGFAVMLVVSAVAVPLPAGVKYWVDGVMNFVAMASFLVGGSSLYMHVTTRPQITVVGPTPNQPGVQTIELRNAHPMFVAAVQQYLNQDVAAPSPPPPSPLPAEPK